MLYQNEDARHLATSRETVYRRWTKKEDDYLRANYSRKTMDEIGVVVSRSASSVYIRAHRLNLHRLTKVDRINIGTLRVQYEDDRISITELAKLYGVCYKTMRNLIHKHNFNSHRNKPR